MDEITSNIDGEVEKKIMKVIYDLAKNHTVIMVAHRISTIIDIPKIIVIENGTKVAEGTHKELLENCSRYNKLFNQIY